MADTRAVTAGPEDAWSDPRLRRELELIRRRGHAGAPVSPHRALLTSRAPVWSMVPSLLLALAFFVAYLLLLGPISRFWAGLIDFFRAVIGLGGHVGQVRYDFYGLLTFDVPYLSFGAGLPNNVQWWMGSLATVLLLVVPILLPSRLMPLAYLMRVVAFFQAGAQIFFAAWPDYFPYEASGYVHGMLIAGMMFIAIVPLLLGFTYFILDYGLGKKIGLTLMAMAHLLLLIPLQYLAHAWLIHKLSLLALPLMFFVFGLALDVLMFICFYALGVSWRSRLRRGDAWWEAMRLRKNGNGNGNGNGKGNGNGHGNGHGTGNGHGNGVGNGYGNGAGARPSGLRMTGGPGSGAGTAALLVFAILSAALSLAPQSAPAQTEPLPETPAAPPPPAPAPSVAGEAALLRTAEVGAAFAHYTEGLGNANGQFARFTIEHPAVWAWRFDVGRDERFGDRAAIFGLGWTRAIGRGATVNLGASTGTGHVIAPRYRFDVGATVPLFGILVNPGYTHIKSKAENYSDGFGLGLTRYFAHWIVGASGRYEIGQPGSTHSRSGGGSLTWMIWRKTYVGAGVQTGRVAYQLVGPAEVLVDYRSTTYTLEFSQWVGQHSGVNLRLDYEDTPFYTLRGVIASVFHEW